MFSSKEKIKKEEKLKRQAAAFQEKYGLTDLQKNDLVILQRIMVNLAGTGGQVG